jgi:hypothetical protein
VRVAVFGGAGVAVWAGEVDDAGLELAAPAWAHAHRAEDGEAAAVLSAVVGGWFGLGVPVSKRRGAVLGACASGRVIFLGLLFGPLVVGLIAGLFNVQLGYEQLICYGWIDLAWFLIQIHKARHAYCPILRLSSFVRWSTS